MLVARLKLTHHQHTGHLRSHGDTSYLALGILMVFIGVALTAFTAMAATPYTGPDAGSIGLTGTMPGKPPTEGAVIKVPTDGQHFGTSPITVSGTCPKGLLVEVFKSDIFAGSTVCGDDGTFSIQVDLLIGPNKLIARVYDALNQPGPDSNAVTVFYDALPPNGGRIGSFDFGTAQMLLNTNAIYRGSFPTQEMSVQLTILGGVPPYAVNIQWGDGQNTLVSRKDNVTFNTPHKYAKAGIYQISFQATDSQGHVAFLTVAAIINGQPDPAPFAAGSAKNNTNNQLLALWPLYLSSIAILIAFWLGEYREKKLLMKRGQLIA